jgi:NTP pyrophosphatase (non-canonical NTP hydrolase)
MNVELEAAANVIRLACEANNAGGTEQAQVYAVAEEAGEFVGAMRRWRGMARRSGTEEEAQNELADVIISSYVMANIMGWDLDDLISRKLGKILTRGWKT